MKIPVATAFLPLLLAAVGCQNTPPPAPTPYTITGKISLTSDCNKPTSPMPVIIKMNLADANNGNALPGSANVNLIGTPPAPLTGTYSITVNWPAAGLPAPANWTDFSITAPNGDPVCKSIGCPNPKKTCTNMAQWHKTVPVARFGKTTEDFSILCACEG